MVVLLLQWLLLSRLSFFCVVDVDGACALPVAVVVGAASDAGTANDAAGVADGAPLLSASVDNTGHLIGVRDIARRPRDACPPPAFLTRLRLR